MTWHLLDQEIRTVRRGVGNSGTRCGTLHRWLRQALGPVPSPRISSSCPNHRLSKNSRWSGGSCSGQRHRCGRSLATVDPWPRIDCGRTTTGKGGVDSLSPASSNLEFRPWLQSPPKTTPPSSPTPCNVGKERTRLAVSDINKPGVLLQSQLVAVAIKTAAPGTGGVDLRSPASTSLGFRPPLFAVAIKTLTPHPPP